MSKTDRELPLLMKYKNFNSTLPKLIFESKCKIKDGIDVIGSDEEVNISGRYIF